MKAIFRSLLTVLAVSVVATGTLALSGCAKNPHLAGGILYLSQKNYEKAVRELQTAVEQDPNNGLAHLKLAMAYAEVDSTKKAGQEFDKAIALSPNLKKDADANRRHYWVQHYNEGLRLSQPEEKKFDEAAREFEKAIDVQPNDASTNKNLGLAYVQLGRREEARNVFEKAAKLYEKAIDLGTTDPADYLDLGLVYAQLGRSDDARATVEKAANLAQANENAKKKLAIVYVDLGHKYYKQQNYSEAIKVYERALTYGPDSTNVMFQLGNCYFQKATAETTTSIRRENYAEATEFYEKALALGADSVNVMFQLGESYFRKAAAETTTAIAKPDFEKAGSFYERVLRKSPDDLEAMTSLGMVKLALDEVNEAIQLLTSVVNKEPKIREAHKLLVAAYAQAGEQELAVTELYISKALDPSRGRRMSELDSWLSQDGMKARYSDTGEMTKILQELGTPEEVYVYEESGSLVETWFYWSKGIGQCFANGKVPPKSRVTFTPVTEK